MMAEVVKRYFIHATDNFVLVFVFSYTSGDQDKIHITNENFSGFLALNLELILMH